ncbi:hypothetical protein [Thalassospira sp.]|uniref:hypothetical protein n=1 Tax=Thalassospira sp. TaxID=1912094 RepID=UPI003AA9790F
MNFKALAALVTGLLILMTTGRSVMAKDMETRTYCVGRFLVDVPAEFEVLNFGGSVRGIRIKHLGPGDEKHAEQFFSERVRKLKAGEFYKDTAKMLFRRVDQIGYLRTVSYLDDWTEFGFQPQEPWAEETFVSVDGVVFQLETAMDDESEDSSQADLLSVAKAIRPRELGDIPKGSGTCLKDAFFSLPAGNENIGATFIHPTERSILLRISTVVRDPGGRALDFSAIEGADGDPVSIAGLKGKELHLQNKQINLSAMVGRQPTRSAPGYKITLEYSDSRTEAGAAPVTLEDAEAIWETLIKNMNIKR